MEDSGAILCQISIFKDMLDQVNREIEANIQVTREIESQIGNCSETESALSVKEAELTKSFLASQFEINGLISVTADSRNSLKLLEDEICRLRNEHSELITRLTEKREGFVKMCFGFQREIEDSEFRNLLLEREFLDNEVRMLEEKNLDVKNSILAYMEDEMMNLLSD
ncbi:hypothetical protein AtNW77_Chr1g0060911 [Arabidopsis thaliana]|uniref:CAP-gly domain linker n=4 Tax=Arabidopsis TaxID=3701 RepID=B3H7F0_ARATH|nr:CAP-gly domain linker [Arabidopsis thaliana]KAG7650193.1 hypothetical protein ISN45_At01g051700 [Arabidopsis thaliana x Arabidopsis arenosa]KAG7658072.1 hypothetical protein ISN44_As01g050750 [Arabidopsis suecica]AEE33834.1 CAP-gly domain linker [Arabidopsis thaliana]OAP11971.1 hypothetical protein AXX17_AT1G54600 [Arabidopsis thaliana]CAD5315992.1 unnamed protein product [Arabidopsis thaliana]|eukprot:NP_001117529.1 CAP-gly domain linker [Arabidopsis thaliana]